MALGKTGCVLLMGAIVLGGCTSAAHSRPPSRASGTAEAAPCGDGVVGFQAALTVDFKVVLKGLAVGIGISQQGAPTGTAPWPYFAKRGVLIRAGTGPVSASVPVSWRGRAAITWGSVGQVEALTLTVCAQPGGVWDAFAGGLYLRSPSECVPVVFRLGGRTATVTFSVGRRCTAADAITIG